jgi:alpha-mannosidase
MALTPEWKRRIENWRDELPRHFYRPLGAVGLAGFATRDWLRPEEALRRRFRPMPPGTRWGAKWEYGWFRGRVVLPAQADGQPIALRVEVGGESAVFVNGRLAGARDTHHTELTLTARGRRGQRFEVLIEAYAGHGPRVVRGGPASPQQETVPEPPAQQTAVGETTFGVWQEEPFQLWLDVETLLQLRHHIDPHSLRVAEIDAGLRDFTTIVDFELPRQQMLDSVRAGRRRLAPLLACVNGSTAPVMYAVGHAHIDTAWLWPLQETQRKCARTFATQLALLEKYPAYRFLCSQPHQYRMVKQRYPALYARIKQAARRGRFIPEGGMWVEADTNLTGGESLIRQFLHGKRFFREEFGVDNKLLWLPDVFGYSGALPQIMRGCGIRWFSTAKIFWTYNGSDPFPYNTFVWEGIDGSEVLAHFCNDYNSGASPRDLIQRWNQRVQQDGVASRLFPFGHGDGGGGPTRVHLEFLRRQRDLEGAPRARLASPREFFRQLESGPPPAARYVGELYFQAHRGTYTSQARTKRGNRKCEFALREAEMWGVAAAALAAHPWPRALMEESWKTVLLAQFHDILPGSSIHRVHAEAEADHARVLRAAATVTRRATAALTRRANAVTVFNSLSWDRRVLVALPRGFKGASGAHGEAVPVQSSGGRLYAEITAPACGWTTLRPGGRTPRLPAMVATSGRLENELLRVSFNDRGEITAILDKETGRDWAAGVCNSFRMYKDVPGRWDAWDIDSMYELTPVGLTGRATRQVIATGPLVAGLRVTRRLGDSPMTQTITLRRGSRRIDFATVMDWRERHKLLKVNFAVSVRASDALHEIQFGHIARPTHRSRPFDADRFEVCQQKWTALTEQQRGCALLNDCKYGVNVTGSSINLTLLKSALAPDMTADRGRQQFTYSFLAWNSSFADCDVVREACDLNCPVTVTRGAAGRRSLFWTDAANVIIETVKPAEDGSGDVVARLYESKRTATRCALGTSLPVREARLADMLENARARLKCAGGIIPLEFGPFQIRTVRLRLNSKR